MKIYIYGNQSFKKEIHETLEHSNIKFKLGDNIVIEEINSLKKLKEAINENPNDIYLIDDEKIIKKNSLNKKIKFLTPKDGIDEEYLLDSGIADLSIDSLSELPKYIIKKYEELKLLEPMNIESKVDDGEEIEPSSIELDEELALLLSKGDNKKQNLTPPEDLDDIFGIGKDINLDDLDEIIGNVDSSKDKNKSNEFDDIVNFNDNFGLNNISLDYDDNDVLYREESDEDLLDTTPKESVDILKELDFLGEEVEEDDTEEIIDLEKINNDLFGGFDFLNEEIQETPKVQIKEEEIDTIEGNPFNDFDFLNDDLDEEEIRENKKFDNEDDEEELNTLEVDSFSEFDFSKEEIVESRKNSESAQGAKMSDEFFELDSLNEKDLLEALSYNVGENNSINEYKPMVSESRNETLSIDSSNVNDLSVLISKLLTNKTLEITIKIKD